jgi:hypothetical protein
MNGTPSLPLSYTATLQLIDQQDVRTTFLSEHDCFSFANIDFYDESFDGCAICNAPHRRNVGRDEWVRCNSLRTASGISTSL